LLADGHGDGLAGIGDGHAALETIRGGHGHRAQPSVAKVLLHFEDELGVHAVEDVLDLQSVENFRQLGGLGEVGVDDGADDLDDGSGVAHECVSCQLSVKSYQLVLQGSAGRSASFPITDNR
jgi:hypothetical protein